MSNVIQLLLAASQADWWRLLRDWLIRWDAARLAAAEYAANARRATDAVPAGFPTALLDGLDAVAYGERLLWQESARIELAAASEWERLWRARMAEIVAIRNWCRQYRPDALKWLPPPDFDYRALSDKMATHLAQRMAELAAKAGKPDEAPVTRGWYSAAELARQVGVSPARQKAFQVALHRLRTAHELPDGAWQEVTDARPNSPRFLYTQHPAIARLARKYQQ